MQLLLHRWSFRPLCVGPTHGNDPVGSCCTCVQMRTKGLEPSRLATPGPKPGASANSATSASSKGGQSDLHRRMPTSQVGVLNFFTMAAISIEYHTRGLKVKTPWCDSIYLCVYRCPFKPSDPSITDATIPMYPAMHPAKTARVILADFCFENNHANDAPIILLMIGDTNST